jgi:hypothetical protein
MKRKLTMPAFVAAAAFAIVSFLPQNANAQAFEIGPRIGYEVDDWDALSLGVDARLGVGALPIRINPYFDYYFVDDIGNLDHSLVQLGINALYEFGVANQAFTPYAGAGLAVSRRSVGDATNTEPGLNLLFGSRFGFGSIRPFVQGNVTIGDYDFFSVQGGLLFPIGM